MSRAAAWLRNPWRRPRFLVAVTWVYLAWALVPVVMAMVFSFNDGKSRSVWQGFSTRWWWGDPAASVTGNAAYHDALSQSLKLAVVNVAVATPLGVLLAICLARWRGYGARPVGFLVALPLVMPELVMAVALFLLITTALKVIPLGTPAQAIGQITYSLAFVVVVTRGRLASIGREFEEAAMDLCATPAQTLRFVLLPMLLPAIVASMIVAFALSIDDFVVTQYMSSTASTTTVPMLIYDTARGSATPALNAVATMLVLFTFAAAAVAYAAYRLLARRSALTLSVD
jgi:spermidine/putrescine transport system permease protein